MRLFWRFSNTVRVSLVTLLFELCYRVKSTDNYWLRKLFRGQTWTKWWLVNFWDLQTKRKKVKILHLFLKVHIWLFLARKSNIKECLIWILAPKMTIFNNFGAKIQMVKKWKYKQKSKFESWQYLFEFWRQKLHLAFYFFGFLWFEWKSWMKFKTFKQYLFRQLFMALIVISHA